MRILSACEATATRQKSCDLKPPPFLAQSCSWSVFVLLPGVEDRSEFTSAVVIHVPLGKHVPCPLIEQLTPVTPLTCGVQTVWCSE